jgi:L-fuculose-phosphate aldolase
MARIHCGGLTTSCGGNASVRDAAGRIWITPAGSDKGSLRPQDIACIGPGEAACGARPSSELALHLHIYRVRPDVSAVAHAHAPALVAFSLTGTVPDTALLAHAAALCGAVAGVPYEAAGSERLGERAADAFEHGFNCAILENHGAVVAGADAWQAYRRLETLEATAAAIIVARGPGGTAPRAGHPPAASIAAAGRPGTSDRIPPPPGVAGAWARELCGAARRGAERRLIRTAGCAISARIDGRSFLISPDVLDPSGVAPADLVRVFEGCCEAAACTAAPMTTRLHEAIYAAHPGINAIIEAAPAGAAAFAISGTVIETRTIPESRLLLREVALVTLRAAAEDPHAVARLVGPERPAALIEGNGALVVGTSVAEAMKRLEVLEATARALLAARALGGVRTLPDEATAEPDRSPQGA